MTQGKIACYADAQDLWRTVKDKNKGKPIRQWLRMYEDRGVFTFRNEYRFDYGYELCKLYPSNHMVFLATKNEIVSTSNSLTMGIRRVFNLDLTRLKKGVYNLCYTTEGQYNYNKYSQDKWADWRKRLKAAHKLGSEYHVGLIFDLSAGTCLNPAVPYKDKPNPEKRREWLRVQRKFRQGMLTRIKVGALNKHIEQEKLIRSDPKTKAPWNRARAPIKGLENAVFTGTFSTEFLTDFIRATPMPQRDPILFLTRSNLVEHLRRVCTSNSLALRKSFGVFDDG